MSEPWTRAVDDDPHSFRDPGSITRLLAGLGEADDERRLGSVRGLTKVVKALEDDPVEESLARVRAELPALVDLLLDRDAEASGCAISILRRIEPTDAAAERLLKHLAGPPEHATALLLEALGLHSSAAFPEPIEQTLCRFLSAPQGARAAAYALYCSFSMIRRSSTVDALRLAAAPDGIAWGRYYSLLTLCCLTSLEEHAAIANEHLDAILDDASAESRQQIAAALGWATRRGLPLLHRLAADPEPSVRLAVAESLVRDEYRARRETQVLLHRLAADEDAEVREFVDLALEHGATP